MVTVRNSGPSNAALEKFEAEFGKTFGADALRRTNKIQKYEVISTGSIALDYALGCGGYIEGRLVEIWGPDGTAKSTMSLIGAAQAQAKHPAKMVGFIDMEAALDLEWARKLGVDLDRMYHVQPDSAEDLADIVKAMVTSGLFSFLVIDSIGGMVNEEEKEKNADERSVGTTPGIITRMVKIAATEARKTGTVVFMINQVRANLGYGSDTVSGGGFALKHSTTHRIKARTAPGQPLTIGSGNEAVQVGVKLAFKVEKNKVAPPKRTAEITLINAPSEKYGTQIGIQDRAQEGFNVGKQSGVIARSGAKYALPDGTTATGEAAVVELLRERPDLIETIRQAALATLSGELTASEAEEG